MSETQSEPFSASKSEYNRQSSAESSCSDTAVAGPLLRKEGPKWKRISSIKQPVESAKNNETSQYLQFP